jgi:two-component system chemotaxis response regulator CheY
MSETESKELHFLVVDDDTDSRTTIVEYLKTLGHSKVTVAKDGTEGARMLDRDPTINFIVSDWDMPQMNGLALLQRVRSSPKHQHLPFLIATSPVSAEAEKVVLAAENMVDSYIIKPFRINTFKEKVEKMIAEAVGGGRKHAVVVDDDNDARQMIVEYLKSLGFIDTHPFAHAKAALEYLTKSFRRVGLIVSDWEMPEMSGIEFLKTCKKTKELTEIPFLMVTSQSSMERMKVMQAARANVDEYLLKPFTGGDLKRRIDALMDRAKSRHQVTRLIVEAIEHFDGGHFQKAQALFEDALKLDPESDVALRGLGDSLAKIRGADAALPHYKKAVDANPMSPKGYLKLAQAYMQIGWHDKALALLQTANRQICFNPDLHYQLGLVYYKKGNFIHAQAEFEKVLEIQLDHTEAKLMLEDIEQNRKKK